MRKDLKRPSLIIFKGYVTIILVELSRFTMELHKIHKEKESGTTSDDTRSRTKGKGKPKMGELLKEKTKDSGILGYLAFLLISYLLTGVLLVVLAFLLYRFQIGRNAVEAGIVVIYLLSAFSGGFLAGKKGKKRKYLLGLAMGSCYFVILAVISLLAGGGVGTGYVTAFLLCAAGGTLGGMLS